MTLKFITKLVFFTFITIQMNAQCDVAANLIHRWEMDNNGLDLVGGNTQSTGFNAYGSNRFDKANKACYIQSANSNTGAFTTIVSFQPFTDYTFSFWAKFEDTNSNYCLMGTQTSINNTPMGFYDNPNIAGTQVTAYLWNGTSSVYNNSLNFNTNTWYFIAYHIRSDSVILFVNGQRMLQNAKPANYNGISRLIGRASGFASRKGWFDDFRIYDNTLTETQLTNMYNNGLKNVLRDANSINLCSTNNKLSVSVAKPTSTFQWYKNGVVISGANDSILVFPSYASSDTGMYFATVNSGCFVDTTKIVSVNISNFDINANTTPLTGSVQYAVGNIVTSGGASLNRFGMQGRATRIVGKQGVTVLSPSYSSNVGSFSLWYQYSSATTSAYSSLLGSSTVNANGVPDRANLVINTSGILGYTNGVAQFVSSGVNMVNNKWYHLVVVRNNDIYKLYVDGIKVLEQNGVFLLSQKSLSWLWGNGASGQALSALGSFDNIIRAYTTALTDADVLDLYNEVEILAQQPYTLNLDIFNQVVSYNKTGFCDSVNNLLAYTVYSSDSANQYTYQWYKNGVALVGSSRLVGVNDDTLSFNPFVLSDTGLYTLKIYKNCKEFSRAPYNIIHDNIIGNNFNVITRQPLCAGQTPQVAYVITGASSSTMQISGTGITGTINASNPYTMPSTGTYVCYATKNGCVTKKYIQSLSPLNSLLVPAYNNPVAVGDSLKLTSNAALYINTNSTNGWSGPAGGSTGAYFNIANATTGMSGIYTVTATNGSSCTITSTLSVVISQPLLVSPKVFLSGPYSTILTLMHDSLRSKQLIPNTEPYSSSAYNATFVSVNSGGETIGNNALSITGNNAIVDWVFVELRSSSNSSNVLGTKAALLQRDGDVVDARDGASPVPFAGLSNGNYFVSIRHRNHLGVMTKNAIALNTSTGNLVDFTSFGTPLYRRTVNNNNFVYSSTQDSCTRKLGTTTVVRALYAGNTNLATIGVPAQFHQVKYNGVGSDRLSLLSLTSTSGSIIGYNKEDVNMSGDAKYNGINNDRLVLLQNIGLNSSNTVYEQLPY